ncbi:MAG TPA: alpha/beta hydrolase [Candidatus Limnocylindria bacterium]|nr:alpha/beta hydrolase [Candidatus Limnocylindria bacterium]
MTGFSVVLDGPADGRRVLLLHGFPQDLRCWDAVVARLAAAGYRCARFDQRGYDPAVRPSEVADYARPFLVADAVSVLDDLGWGDALVVGHDWGALVAWAVAAGHPERVSGLVAVSVPHPAAFGAALRSDPDQQARSAYIGLFREPDRAETVLLADGARRLRAMYGDLPAEVAEAYVTRFSDPDTLTAALGWYRAMDAANTGALGPVAVPTRYVWGDGDVAVGRVAAEGCAAWVTGDYGFVELPGVSHWAPETAPDAVAAAVLSL